MRYWPFLIAANRKFDYLPAICPDFLEARGGDLFRRHLDPRSYASEGLMLSAKADDPKLGALDLHYKTEFVRDPNNSERYITDEFGRHIYFVYGVITQPERRDERIDEHAAERLVDSHRAEAVSHLQKFIASEVRPAILISRARRLGEGTEIVRKRETPPPTSPPQPPPPAAPLAPAKAEPAVPEQSSRQPRSAETVTASPELPTSKKQVTNRRWAIVLSLIALISVPLNVYLLIKMNFPATDRASLHQILNEQAARHNAEIQALNQRHQREINRHEDEKEGALADLSRQKQEEINRLEAEIDRLTKNTGAGAAPQR